MNDLPFFVVSVKKSDDWLAQYNKSWNTYTTIIEKHNLTNNEKTFIYDNIRHWIEYIVKNVNKNHGEEFYVSFKTHSININVKLTYLDQ